jgi:hypothetical protein
MAHSDYGHQPLLWSMRVRRGAVRGMYCQPMQPTLALGDLSLRARRGRPWLSLDLALALAARGALTWPAHAVLCKKRSALYMAVTSEDNVEIKLHRYARGNHESWSIQRPSPGRLTHLSTFGKYAALIDVPERGRHACLDTSRLILHPLDETDPVTLSVELGGRCRGPGIVNAGTTARQCVLDLILDEPDVPGRLWRCNVERYTGVWSKRLLSSCHVVDAVVKRDRRGPQHSFAYLSGVDAGTGLSGLCSLDLAGRTSHWRNIPFAQSARGLAILGARAEHHERRNWLATIVHDHANDRSGIVLGPLKALAMQPNAMIRVPSGLLLGDTLAWSPRPPLGRGELVHACSHA